MAEYDILIEVFVWFLVHLKAPRMVKEGNQRY